MHTSEDAPQPFTLESHLAELPILRVQTIKDLEKLAYYVHQLVDRLNLVTAGIRRRNALPNLDRHSSFQQSLIGEQAALQAKISRAAALYLEVPIGIKHTSWYRAFDTQAATALAQIPGRPTSSDLAQTARKLNLDGAKIIPTLERQPFSAASPSRQIGSKN